MSRLFLCILVNAAMGLFSCGLDAMSDRSPSSSKDSSTNSEDQSSSETITRDNQDSRSTQQQKAPLDFEISVKGIQNSQPEIAWQTSKNAKNYKVIISDSRDCQNVILESATLTSHVWKPSTSIAAGNYYACVTAHNGELAKTAKNNGLSFEVKTGWNIASPLGTNPEKLRSERTWGGAWTGQSILTFAASRIWEYKFSTNRWTNPPHQNGPSAAVGWYSQVWTGEDLIVFGGKGSGSSASDQLYAYNYKNKTWREIDSPSKPSGTQGHFAVWADDVMIVWGGAQGSSFASARNQGFSFNPKTNEWTEISNVNGPGAKSFGASVWTGTEMYVIGGLEGDTPSRSIHAYNKKSNTWRLVGELDKARAFTSAALGNDKILVFGGADRNTTDRNDYLDDYVMIENNTVTVIPANAAHPTSRFSGGASWDGTAFVIYGGFAKDLNKADEVSRFYP